MTALLLELELRHAAPYLGPFLRWAHTLGIQPEIERLAMEVYLGVGWVVNVA